MNDEPKHIATAAAPLDDPYAALSQHLHGDGDAPPLRITYRNWRGEVSERNIVPQSVWFGATEWHPEPQWLLSALDTDKGAARDFALADFGANDDTWRTRALAAEAEVERLRKALMMIAHHNVPPEEPFNGRSCKHGRIVDEDCNLCTAAFARAALKEARHE